MTETCREILLVILGALIAQTCVLIGISIGKRK